MFWEKGQSEDDRENSISVDVIVYLLFLVVLFLLELPLLCTFRNLRRRPLLEVFQAPVDSEYDHLRSVHYCVRMQDTVPVSSDY